MSGPSYESQPRRVAETVTRRSLVALLVLALYLLVLVALTMTPHPRQPAQMVNLVPLKSILAGIQRGGWLLNVNVLGNVVAFVPLGLLVPLVSRRFKLLTAVLSSSLLLSAAIEAAQWLLARRVVDIDDIILNVVGAFVGYGCYLIFRLPAGSKGPLPKDQA